MNGINPYPDKGLDIRVDENGNMSYVPNPGFARYYAQTPEEKEEETEELRHELTMLELEEPNDVFSAEHDDWEDEIMELKERIREMEESIEST